MDIVIGFKQIKNNKTKSPLNLFTLSLIHTHTQTHTCTRTGASFRNRADEMAQLIRTIVKPDSLSSTPWKTHGGRRETTPTVAL